MWHENDKGLIRPNETPLKPPWNKKIYVGSIHITRLWLSLFNYITRRLILVLRSSWTTDALIVFLLKNTPLLFSLEGRGKSRVNLVHLWDFPWIWGMLKARYCHNILEIKWNLQHDSVLLLLKLLEKNWN